MTAEVSQHVDFGFAHNTPMEKRKFKVGINVKPDGRILIEFGLWPGRTAGLATIQENIERSKRLLQRQGCSVAQIKSSSRCGGTTYSTPSSVRTAVSSILTHNPLLSHSGIGMVTCNSIEYHWFSTRG